MALASLLPILAFALLFLALVRLRGTEWRRAFLLAALGWGLAVTALTELLSLAGWLAFWPLVLAWGALAACLLAIHIAVPAPGQAPAMGAFAALSPFQRALLGLLASVTLWIGILAWVAPPNTGDSMSYHMSRVMHWMEDGSVSFYPTHILRQLFQGPWAEFAILQFQILSGGDRFANFVQWFAMAGSLVGVSLIAKGFGAGVRGQLIAAAVCATLPMGILQGSSTQTDYAVTFWLVCFVCFGMALVKNGGLVAATAAGAALGLALLTKATAYIYAAPFALWFLVSFVRSAHGKKAAIVLAAVVVVCAVNAGQYARNYALFGSPLGPARDGEYTYANDTMGARVIASNILRNAALHLGTPAPAVNDWVERLIVAMHTVIGISPDDQATTWKYKTFHVPRANLVEDTAGNPVQLFLIALALLIYWAGRNRERQATSHALALLAGFVLFSAYLKWQPWNSRLQLPLFVLWSPFVGLVLGNLRHRKIMDACVIGLFALSVPWLLKSLTKPVIPLASGIFSTSRSHQYFTPRPALEAPYREAVALLSRSGCARVGLISAMSSWEYPLWALLQQAQPGAPLRLTAMDVRNVSVQATGDAALRQMPCAVVTLDAATPGTRVLEGAAYRRAWSSGPVSVYFLQSGAARSGG